MKPNDKYEILTPDGWKSFTGVAYTGVKNTHTLELSNGKQIIATPEHKFVKDGSPTPLGELHVGDRLETIDGEVSIVNIKTDVELRDCYDIVDVHNENHQYVIEDSLLTSNCDELAFVSKRIALEFWTSVFPTLSCLTGDTWVLSDNGFRQIKDYFHHEHKAGDYFLMDGEQTWGKHGIEPISHGYVSPASKTYIIETHMGHRLEVTEDHPLFTLTGHKGSMVKARALTIGDRVRVDIGMRVFGDNHLSEDDAYQLGTDFDGHVPRSVMQGDEKTVVNFLAGLCDHHASITHQGVELSLGGSEGRQEVKLLLNNLGVVSYWKRDIHRLVIHHPYTIDLFENVPLRKLPQQKSLDDLFMIMAQSGFDAQQYPAQYVRDHILEALATSEHPTSYYEAHGLSLNDVESCEHFSYEWIEHAQRLGLSLGIETGAFVWDEIVAIEESYQEVTYDFTVPGTHSFLQNGVLGSNTGGSCIITSTPTDDETLFANIWKKANDCLDEFGNVTEVGSNGFKALKIKWDEHPERDEGFKELMIKQFGEEKFRREHELDFIAEDETLISPLVLSEMKGKEPIQKTGQVRWYKELDREKIYLIGYDPSLGTGGDNAAIEIFEFPSMEQVGEWMHNKSDVPTQLRVLKKILNMFKDAGFDEDNVRWTLENNAIGEAPLVLIDEYGEDEFFGYFMSEPFNPLDAKKRRRFRKGYNTNASSKLTACTRMKRWIEQGTMTVHSIPLIKELKGFVARGRTYKARVGDHDDLVMAAMLVVRMAMVTMDEDDEFLDTLGVRGDDDDELDDWDQPLPVIF